MKWYQIFSDGTVIYDDDLKQDTIYPDGCSIEIPTKSLRWFKNNKLHRDGGPAAVYTDGTKHWFQNGKHHRIDGPAREYANGEKYWYIEGVCYFEHKYNIKMKTYHNEKEKEA